MLLRVEIVDSTPQFRVWTIHLAVFSLSFHDGFGNVSHSPSSPRFLSNVVESEGEDSAESTQSNTTKERSAVARNDFIVHKRVTRLDVYVVVLLCQQLRDY
mmetsp:Transcript_14265/g.19505  ORF Transcript_14265/g.19505 Transcript_14265/m.19505 type:complete len:101 (-) Transcript_14265:182-484(-)